MRTAIRAIALTAAVGTAAIAAPVMSIGGSTPADQASARPATPRPYDPETDPDNHPICPPGSIALSHSCAYPPPREDGLSAGEIGVIIVSSVFMLTFGAAGA